MGMPPPIVQNLPDMVLPIPDVALPGQGFSPSYGSQHVDVKCDTEHAYKQKSVFDFLLL